jgi:ribosome biogenesis protein BRX1
MEAHRAKKQSGQSETTSLVEIGPRFVLNPIRIFRGSFGGQTLYQNPNFVSPNAIRARERREKGLSYEDRKLSQKKRKERKEQIVVPEDPLASVFRE